jgi:hypothetical protein
MRRGASPQCAMVSQVVVLSGVKLTACYMELGGIVA